MKDILLFTYGTLMNNERNHYHLANQTFISKAIVKNYDLYNLGTYPGIIKGDGEVLGEIYKIDFECLKKIDILEENGHLYDRITEKVYLPNNEEADAYLYIYKHEVKKENKYTNNPMNYSTTKL